LAPGVTVHHVDAGPPEPVPKDDLLPHMGRFAELLAREWRATPPDVVHSHFWMSGIAALDAARGLPVPVTHTFHALGVVKRRHQGAADTSPPRRIDEERRIAATADRVIATCSDEVFELVRQGADRRRLSVVPCGVDVERFTPDGAAEPAPRPRIVCVGRLVERKGVADVVRALPDLPGVDLVVAGGPPAGRIGDDPEATRLRAIAQELGVADRVELRGGIGRADVPPLMRSAVAVVCAPWYEPFGIVPLEAMACGVPVIASSVGGMIDSVVHAVTGLHVPPRRPDRIAAAVRELIDDPARREALGEAGVARARGRYTWDRVAAGTLEAYAQCGAAASPAMARVRR
jgi:glycosyltransferase involved in cell wall biosynthesis